ncbi:MAG TPA: hypothetical protein VK453_25675 [Micromonosporaceae bacterium]|nr:hypothetical protein [Micromonosporaceae bacterium]
MTDEEDVLDYCPSGGCAEQVDCGACEDGGDDEWAGCYRCGGSGWYVPEHCCQCGGSPYCTCCGKCGALSVTECKCPIQTERDGKVVTV